MQNSFSALEFESVREILLEKTQTEVGLKQIFALSPLKEAAEIRLQLETVSQFVTFNQSDGKFRFDELIDIRPYLDNAKVEGSQLDRKVLFAIQNLLTQFYENFLTASSYFEKYPQIEKLLTSAEFPEELYRELEQIFDSDGSIKDNASSELSHIRKRQKTIKGEIRGMLAKMLDSKDLKDAIQDRTVTLRDGRYVIPMKISHKNSGGSVVHSLSKSGETAFVEPAKIVPLNNEMTSLDGREIAEINKILRNLTAVLRRYLQDIRLIATLHGQIESFNVRARFSIEFHCSPPEIMDEAAFYLAEARHPLLQKKMEPIPITLKLGERYNGMVISGPNAGGKTVALKTAGLLILMALSGIPIPVKRGSSVGMFSKVLSEIGDDQSIADDLSSFSGHIVNLSAILNAATPDTLVLIDEIASSTAPKEGAAIAREYMIALSEKGSRFIVTTHFQALKELSYTNEKIVNAFVQFDEEALRPLYELSIGISGKSYALEVAERFGLPKEILQKAADFIEENTSREEKLVSEIESEREKIELQRSEVEKAFADGESLRLHYLKQVERLEEKEKQLSEKAHSKLRRELDDTLIQVAALREELSSKKKLEALERADEIIQKAGKKLNEAAADLTERASLESVEIGQTVYIASLEKEGVVESVSGKKVRVRVGIVTMNFKLSDLFETDQPESEKTISVKKKPVNSDGPEYTIDIRGERFEDALRKLESSVDKALIEGQSSISIIHGKGTGVLRKMVQDFLRGAPFVDAYDYARPEDGGQGKTIVTFK